MSQDPRFLFYQVGSYNRSHHKGSQAYKDYQSVGSISLRNLTQQREAATGVWRSTDQSKHNLKYSGMLFESTTISIFIFVPIAPQTHSFLGSMLTSFPIIWKKYLKESTSRRAYLGLSWSKTRRCREHDFLPNLLLPMNLLFLQFLPIPSNP